jgi:inhibitor of cysteine peptidase
LTVTLCSNPTTGFQWSENAEISNPQVIAQTEHKFLTPEEKNIVGGAGQEVWTFSALEPGQTSVYLEYSRPWEGGEKGEWTFTLTVIVKSPISFLRNKAWSIQVPCLIYFKSTSPQSLKPILY